MTAITVCLLVAGCGSAVDGRGSAASSVSPTGRVLGTPSADGPLTREPTSSGSTTRTSTTPSTTTSTTTTTTTDAPPVGTDSADPSTTGDAPATPGTAATGLPDVLLGPVSLEPGPDGYVTFQTPSGNIFCGLGAPVGGTPASVRCDLLEADYPDVPAVPCDFGDFVPGTASLDAAGTAVVGGCVGDTVVDPNAVELPYGGNARAGDLVCHSAEDGVTCGDLVSGHGFQVSRGAHRVF